MVANLTRNSFLSRVRVSLQRRVSESLQVLVTLDTYNSHNHVLYLGIKYKHNLLALPLFSS